jgi:hypothetical protein
VDPKGPPRVIVAPLQASKKKVKQLQHARTHARAEYDFHTKSVVNTHTRASLTRMRVNFTLTIVIATRTNVIYTRRV